MVDIEATGEVLRAGDSELAATRTDCVGPAETRSWDMGAPFPYHSACDGAYAADASEISGRLERFLEIIATALSVNPLAGAGRSGGVPTGVATSIVRQLARPRKKPGGPFTAKERRAIVRKSQDDNRSVAEIARDEDLATHTLYRWRSEAKAPQKRPGRKPIISPKTWQDIVVYARKHGVKEAARKWNANPGTVDWKERQTRPPGTPAPPYSDWRPEKQKPKANAGDGSRK